MTAGAAYYCRKHQHLVAESSECYDCLQEENATARGIIRTLEARIAELGEAAVSRNEKYNLLLVKVANLESQVAAAAEPWHVQSAMLNAVTTERDRYRAALSDW